MAKIICEKHGKSLAASVCKHISGYLKNEKPFKAISVTELLFDEKYKHHLCTDCAISFSLKNEQVFAELPELIDQGMAMVCACCFQSIYINSR